MSHQPPRVPPRTVTQTDPDTMERAVLGMLVSLHPIQLTLDELVRAMTEGAEDFGSCDSVVTAASQLVGSGLLHRHGQFVLPTRAALRAMELG